MVWRAEDPQGNEAAKVKYDVVPYTRGVVLDLGCGPNKAFPHFIGVDSCKDTDLFGIPIKPDVKCDVADPEEFEKTFNSVSVDAIFSSHCLEHIERYDRALNAWWEVLKEGGHLVLYLPHRDLYPNIGTEDANPDHKHDLSPEDIVTTLDALNFNFDILVNETRSQDMEYSFLLVVKKLAQRHQGEYSYLKPRPAKTACVVRYGGFGDMIQTANILPALKREGFHVTVMTSPQARAIIEHDPHVDDWFIQDTDQVPNEELGPFWRSVSKRFDRFINLSESIEGHLLALPGRSNHMWPDAVRRKELGRNYLEWTAQLAQVPYASEAKFYPTHDEMAQSRRYLEHVKHRIARLRPRNAAQQIMGLMPRGDQAVPLVRPVFHIMWCLSGSSVHKAYPHMDAVIARILMEMPEAAIHLTGDAACVILEAGWENEPRVFRQSGEMSIRQTLTLAKDCDCVMGPETGVLNAVAFEDNWKVLMLSHSSFENLPKHWINTIAIEPNRETAPCYPCHRLHYGREFCPFEEQTHAAMCAFSISPDTVYQAVRAAYSHWKGEATVNKRELEAA